MLVVSVHLHMHARVGTDVGSWLLLVLYSTRRGGLIVLFGLWIHHFWHQMEIGDAGDGFRGERDVLRCLLRFVGDQNRF